MKIEIDAGAKEIAGLVLAIQNRRDEEADKEAIAAAIRGILLEFAEPDGTHLSQGARKESRYAEVTEK